MIKTRWAHCKEFNKNLIRLQRGQCLRRYRFKSVFCKVEFEKLKTIIINNNNNNNNNNV